MASAGHPATLPVPSQAKDAMARCRQSEPCAPAGAGGDGGCEELPLPRDLPVSPEAVMRWGFSSPPAFSGSTRLSAPQQSVSL